MTPKEMRDLALQCVTHPASRSITDIGNAGLAVFELLARVKTLEEAQTLGALDEEMNAQLREQNEAVGEACAAMEAELEALRTSIGEPVAVIKSTEKYGFPLLEWLSADHSFRAPIGSLLYAIAQKGE